MDNGAFLLPLEPRHFLSGSQPTLWQNGGSSQVLSGGVRRAAGDETDIWITVPFPEKGGELPAQVQPVPQLSCLQDLWGLVTRRIAGW